MAYQLTNKQVLLAKYGGTPTTSDVVTLAENTFFNTTIKNGTIKEIGTGALGAEKGFVIPDWTAADGTITAIMKATGAAGTPPKLSEMYKICGLTETIDTTAGEEKVTYTPMTQMGQTGEIISYIDGEKRTITGVVSNLKINFTVGELVRIAFDIKGFTDAEPVLEANPSATIDGNSNFVVKSVSAVTIDGATINLTSADFDLGNQIDEIYAIGKKEYVITDFMPTITINEIKQRDSIDHWTDLKNENVKAFVVSLGSSSGEKVTFTANYCKYSGINESDDNGKVVIERSFRCESNAGGDNFEIKYE
ncbi:phage tail tube protein [Hydrogenimonas urashimensis]|uniref:phage tail tube protein n=1 Tax=Hydrogenimonas urashimensis TaxID=2740515 RepID=UPI0019154BAA|nr:phage tail tube protein [Hydrogenimonas urashimensis]